MGRQRAEGAHVTDWKHVETRCVRVCVSTGCAVMCESRLSSKQLRVRSCLVMHIRNSSDSARRIRNFKKERLDFPAADDEEEGEGSMLKVGGGLGGGQEISCRYISHRTVFLVVVSQPSPPPQPNTPHSFQSSCHRVCSTSQHDDATQTIHQDTPANQNETQHKHA